MKKWVCTLLALLACLMLATAAAADAVQPDDGDIDVSTSWKCAGCNRSVGWDVLPSKMPTAAGHYHYYLTRSVTPEQMSTPDGVAVTICLDLNGFGIDTEGRSMIVKTGTTWNVMDSSRKQTGYIRGTSGNNNTSGGTVTVQENATLNLYSGTLKYVYDGTGYKIETGGVVNMRGTMNMYGGKVEGAQLTYDTEETVTGAAIQVTSTGKLTVSGGEITSGSVPEGGKGKCVYLAASSSSLKLLGNANIGEIYTAAAGNLTVIGNYTGTARLRISKTPAAGLVVGVSDGATISGDLFCTNGDGWDVKAVDSDLVLMPHDAPVIAYKGDEVERYDTLQEAVNNAAGGYVKLMQPVTGNVTVREDLYLDLNGNSINGTVTVAAGATLYGMDSQTDDYTVKDAAGYGKLTVTGEGKVLGVPEESELAEHGYMMITEEDGVSFHAVNLKLTAMTLRAEEAGVYYKSSFGGDELVAQRVTQYGVALSVKAVPTAENLESECKYSTVKTDFAAGGMDEDATSTLLKGVMKTTNAGLINNRNANMPIYGRAYILTEDGYMFGACAQRSFKEQVEGADSIWGTLSAEQKAAVVAMYETYRDVMKNWNIPNVIGQKDPSGDGVLKILGIGNSYTNDSMWMLYNVYKAENPDKEIVFGIAYFSGCTLAQHVQFINEESPVYEFHKINDERYAETGTWKTTKGVTLKSIVENENWDIVTMQQASAHSGRETTYNSDIQTIQKFVDATLGYTPKFAWNMTWAYPEKDIEGDAFTTVNTTNSFKNYYQNSQATMYQMIVDTVKAKIVPDKTFTYLMPVGVAIQNANASYLDDPDLYRDYTHLNDFSRVIAAYVWYCTFEEVRVDSLKFTTVPAALTNSYKTAGGTGDMVLTDAEIAIILEAVNNALTTKEAGTFAVTQSQYTTK